MVASAPPDHHTDPKTDARAEHRRIFLQAAGWGDALVSPLAADASFRSYHRVRRPDGQPGAHRAVLMDAPPPKEDVRPFRHIAVHLEHLGYSAPRIMAEDASSGFLLLEDFGDQTFTRMLSAVSGDEYAALEQSLYELAIDLLIDLHATPPGHAIPADCPEYTPERLLEEAMLYPDWFLADHSPVSATARQAYGAAWNQVFPSLRACPTGLVLRDFHVDNLMRLEDRSGLAACGLLDFQDAVAGPIAYDTMSLLEDARRDLDPQFVAYLRRRWEAGLASVCSAADLDAAWAILAAQRHAKVIGIFTRLDRRDGKPQYLGHIPRVQMLMARAMGHPALTPVRQWFEAYDPDALIPV